MVITSRVNSPSGGLGSTATAAYVFAKPAAGWPSELTETNEILAPNNDWCGQVAISGNTIVLGSPEALVANSWQGTAYVDTYNYDPSDLTSPAVTLIAPTAVYRTDPTITVSTTDIGVPDGAPVLIDGDLNNDGDFTDPGETNYAPCRLVNGSATITVYLPAQEGTYRLRARVSDPSGNVGVSNVVTLVAAGPKCVGVYDPSASVFYERDTNNTGCANNTFQYGPSYKGWIPLSGDWDGNGIDSIGLYDPKTSIFYLQNANDTGAADVTFDYGPAGAGWIPIAGDWNGDGKDTIGLYDPRASVFYLRNSNDTGYADVTFAYGQAHPNVLFDTPTGSGWWKPVVGDWNGDGRDTIGLYDPAASVFYLRSSNTTGYANQTFAFGQAHGRLDSRGRQLGPEQQRHCWAV